MNIWSEMMTTLGSNADKVDSLANNQLALKILDREIRALSAEVKQSKNDYNSCIDREKKSKKKTLELKASINQHEPYVLQALEKNNKDLALEVAEKIAQMECQLSEEKNIAEDCIKNLSVLSVSLMQSEASLKRLKQQVDTVKAAENLLRAEEALAEGNSNNDLKSHAALTCVARIQKRKPSLAVTPLSQSSTVEKSQNLLEKLEQAGIKTQQRNAEEIVQRLKKESLKNSQ